MRSIGKANQVTEAVRTQAEFDELFYALHSDERIVTMRAADAIEKITQSRPEFLTGHKKELLNFLGSEMNIELKWHLALLMPRLSWEKTELAVVWSALKTWAADKTESKIVRANSIQALCELSERNVEHRQEFETILHKIGEENVPSLNARIRQFRKKAGT